MFSENIIMSTKRTKNKRDGDNNMQEKAFLEESRDDAAEFLETLKKVPENRKDEVLGILKGYALCAESEQKVG